MSLWQQTREHEATPGSGGYGCSPERPGRGAEGLVAGYGPESLVKETSLMEEIVKKENLIAALKKVEENGGAPGIDGMTIKELTPYLKKHWPRIREELLSGKYKPSPVRRVEIPKASGGTRKLGIPTVYSYYTSYSRVLEFYITKPC